MAVAAEQLTYVDPALEQAVNDAYAQTGLVEVIPDTFEDAEIRMQAARFIGSCLAGREAEVAYTAAEQMRPIESLYDAIKMVAETNDLTARRMVTSNVNTDIFERTVKEGLIIEVDLHADEAQRILQHGQYLETVQANSLRRMADASPQMLERTKIEAVNSFRMQKEFQEGRLQDDYFVVISRAPDNMTTEQMAEEGFFTDTMSYAIQATTVKNGRLTTESAFLAGVKSKDGERQDAKAVAGLGDWLGVNLHDMTAAQTLDTPIRVNKKLMPNGVSDLVEVCDDTVGGFFGSNKPRQNYADYLEQCKEREAFLQPKVQSIVEELVSEAATIQNPVHATQRLHKISEKHMVQQAMFDKQIDPRVFGPAARHIELGRWYFEQGNIDAGLLQTRKAESTAVSSSCPDGKMRGTDGQSNEGGDSKSEELKDCDFVSAQCPVCKEKPARTKVRKGKYYHVGKGCSS